MEVDFFQVLRRVQKEERNKSSLARVDNDFYKQLREYIRDLERSVASDPFGNEQLLLNNAQRIATEICELRESKITKAANNNIYRSFLLFKKDNPQFDLLDTTPLNLTEEEETLYFSLMDALKNHRYRISLDEYTEESTLDDSYGEEDDFDEDDDETAFVEDSYEESIESESTIDEELEDEISDALGESIEADSGLDGSPTVQKDTDDEVLARLGQIKDAKVITDEKYEHIDTQVANQTYPGQSTEVGTQAEPQVRQSSQTQDEVRVETQSDVKVETREEVKAETQSDVKVESQKPQNEVQPKKEESSKGSFGSGNINDILKDPDSQFADLDSLEPNYDNDYYDSIAAGSNYAAPSEDDFNMIFAKPKKSKSEEPQSQEAKSDEIKSDGIKQPDIMEDSSPKVESTTKFESTQSDLGFSSGLDVKEGNVGGINKDIQKPKEDNAPKKPVDKTRGGLFTREEVENTTVVISEDVGEMVGIDGKVYGPFLENDVVILPNITAKILIENNKASLVKL